MSIIDRTSSVLHTQYTLKNYNQSSFNEFKQHLCVLMTLYDKLYETVEKPQRSIVYEDINNTLSDMKQSLIRLTSNDK